LPCAFGEPAAEDVDGVAGQRGDAVFAALAVAGDVRADAKVEVAAAQPDELRDAQAGLNPGLLVP
jgi:hypothetical protein